MRHITIKTTDGETIKGYEVDVTEAGVTMIHSEGGTAYIPKEDINKLSFGAKVKGEIKITAPVKEVAKAVAKPVDGKISPKVQQVIDILKANPDLTTNRKAAIARIVADVGMSEGGASTYYNTAKKYL